MALRPLLEGQQVPHLLGSVRSPPMVVHDPSDELPLERVAEDDGVFQDTVVVGRPPPTIPSRMTAGPFIGARSQEPVPRACRATSFDGDRDRYAMGSVVSSHEFQSDFAKASPATCPTGTPGAIFKHPGDRLSTTTSPSKDSDLFERVYTLLDQVPPIHAFNCSI